LASVERITQRGVHVLLSQHAIHYEFLAGNRKFDVPSKPLALLLTKLCGHPT